MNETTSEGELLATMGFASFGGRPRKRAKKTHRHRPPPPELVHLSPGTTLEALATSLPGDRVRLLPVHNVLALVRDPRHPTRLREALQPRDPEASHAADAPTRSVALASASEELLIQLQWIKSRFGELPPPAFTRARALANPYEAIGRGRFLNRSAMKLANLDHIFSFTRGRPVEVEKKETKTDLGPFVFADLCGGPGGFSEYLLWRLQQQKTSQKEHTTRPGGVNEDPAKPIAVGFGITLKGTSGACEWRLEERPSAAFQFHIVDGADGTGNLYAIDNVRAFQSTIRRAYPDGANLVVADGGFPDARDQMQQEILMTRLVVAEVLTMFCCLRGGGSFVCKTFEITSPLMLKLAWILHCCFEELTIVKPVTTRPASSERYIVARFLDENAPVAEAINALEALLKEFDKADGCLSKLQGLLASDVDVNADVAFLDFMTEVSVRLATAQLDACDNILAAASNERTSRSVSPEQYYRVWDLQSAASEFMDVLNESNNYSSR